MDWPMNEAEERLGEVIDRALCEGPQTIVRQDRAVVVVAAEDYERLAARRRDFIDHLMSGPSLEGIDLTRDRSPPREVDLG